MICPFRVGVKFEHAYIGKDTEEDRQKPDNYIEVAQHAVFEPCEKDECPYYLYTIGCQRVNDDYK